MMRVHRQLPFPRFFRSALLRFMRREDGAMVVLALFIIIAMMIVMGLSVDVMRAEQARFRMQNALDQAVLAAADLDQTLNPEQVVRDYLTKSNILGDISKVTVAQVPGSREVAVTVNGTVPTVFLDVMNRKNFVVSATSTAKEAALRVEISLVLDVSASMLEAMSSRDPTTKLDVMKVAASNFVDQVLRTNSDASGLGTSVNLVPYAGNVNLGAPLFNLWHSPPEGWPGGSRIGGPAVPVERCLELLDADFDGNTGRFTGSRITQVEYRRRGPGSWCPSPSTALVPGSNNRTALLAAINGMKVAYGTGTNYAVRYGLMLLDPEMKAEFAELADRGVLPTAFADRPRPFTEESTKKYIVLMTDGNMLNQVRPRYSGLIDNDADSLDNERIQVPGNNQWIDDPDNVDGIDWDLYNRTTDLYQEQRSSNSVPLFTDTDVARQLIETCDAAKAEGVIVYTIAFNAGTTGEAQMQACASSPAHYSRVTGNRLNAAFSSIASQINQLRLTR